MTDILLVGCGNMGRAMMLGWLRMPEPPRVFVVEPSDTLRSAAVEAGASVVATAAELPAALEPDVVVLAVKPQVISDVLPDYRRFAGSCFVSVAAGTTMDVLSRGLGEAAIVRCMPNTPASIGQGVFGVFGNDRVDPEMKTLVRRLLATSGQVFDLPDEVMVDRITAVSGSGPAYVFHFVEALAEAGVRIGLPAEMAADVARQTVYGAATLARESAESVGDLRRAVTSPNGTTAAALDVLMGDERLTRLMTEAVEAAFARARELGRN